MYPWAFSWAPRLYFPLSGSVAQAIDTSAFFDSIDPSAGDGQIEKRAFEIASYGRQLGLITEVLIGLAEKVTPESEEAKTSLERLKAINAEIQQLKQDDATSLMRQIDDRVALLKRRHPNSYLQLRAGLESPDGGKAG